MQIDPRQLSSGQHARLSDQICSCSHHIIILPLSWHFNAFVVEYFTHTHTHTHARTHTHSHTHCHTSTHKYTHTHTLTHTHTHTHTNTHTHTQHTQTLAHAHTMTCTCSHIHARTHTHLRIFIHAHTNTHTHTHRIKIFCNDFINCRYATCNDVADDQLHEGNSSCLTYLRIFHSILCPDWTCHKNRMCSFQLCNECFVQTVYFTVNNRINMHKTAIYRVKSLSQWTLNKRFFNCS